MTSLCNNISCMCKWRKPPVFCDQFAELESILGDAERTRAIFQLAIQQPQLDMPEMLWKAYIDFEIENEEYDKTRDLYRRLLARTNHVKV